MLDLVLLGSGGWMPTSARQTCSVLLRQGDHAVIIDAGTGVCRLAERPELLKGVRRADLVLTHFHLDHVVGLTYLPALRLPVPPRILGPGRWLYGESTAEILARLIAPPFFALDLATLGAEVEDIGEAGFELAGFQVKVRIQHRHDAPTVALRFGDVLTYCTDTAYDEANAVFARGSRVLAHDAWSTEASRGTMATHSSAREAATVAQGADVEHLVLIHIQPGFSAEALADEARAIFSAVTVGDDLLSMPPCGSAGPWVRRP